MLASGWSWSDWDEGQLSGGSWVGMRRRWQVGVRVEVRTVVVRGVCGRGTVVRFCEATGVRTVALDRGTQ